MTPTTRDSFALAAMQGMVSSIQSESDYQRWKFRADQDSTTVSRLIAREAYKQADAMMLEWEANR